MNEFDWIVIGEEPGGMWLMDRLCRESFGGKPTRVGWIRMGKPLRPLCVSKSLAGQLQLGDAPTWSCEIQSPTQSWSWDSHALLQECQAMGVELRPANPANFRQALVRQRFRENPDLYLRLQTIWKFLGTSDVLSEGRLLHALAPCTELMWWDPQNQLRVHDIATIDTDDAWTLEFNRYGKAVIHFKNQDAWVASRCLWNTTQAKTAKFLNTQPELEKTMPAPQYDVSPWALCPFDLQMEPLGVPVNVPPLIFFVAADGIVDPHTEVLPIEIHRNESDVLLRVWVSVRQPFSLDSAVDRGNAAIGQLKKLFPYFDQTLKSIWPPLFVGDCYSDPERERVQSSFENSLRETYRLSALHLESRVPAFQVLPPNFECHLPHPAGPLLCAQKILEEWKAQQCKLHRKTDANPPSLNA